jgi:hypothetical protein
MKELNNENMKESKEFLKIEILVMVVLGLMVYLAYKRSTNLTEAINYANQVNHYTKERGLPTIEQPERVNCKVINQSLVADPRRDSLKFKRGRKITTFDCGYKIGIISTDDDAIFRKAKENSILKVYFYRGSYQILGIDHE